MRKPLIASLVVMVTLFASAGILLSEPDGPDGNPNIAGTWEGKVRVKLFDMTGNDDDYRAREAVQVKILQKGSGLDVLIIPDGGNSIDMSGQIGDGHFWLYAETEDGPLVWVGHVRNKGRRIIGKLLGGENDGALDIKVQLKRLKEEDLMVR